MPPRLIRLYSRCVDRLHILYRFTTDESCDLIQRYLSSNPDPTNQNIMATTTRVASWEAAEWDSTNTTWISASLSFGIWSGVLPMALTTVEWVDPFVSVYSQDNPQLLFSMCGFEIRILPKIRTMSGEQYSSNGPVCVMKRPMNGKRSACPGATFEI